MNHRMLAAIAEQVYDHVTFSFDGCEAMIVYENDHDVMYYTRYVR